MCRLLEIGKSPHGRRSEERRASTALVPSCNSENENAINFAKIDRKQTETNNPCWSLLVCARSFYDKRFCIINIVFLRMLSSRNAGCAFRNVLFFPPSCKISKRAHCLLTATAGGKIWECLKTQVLVVTVVPRII